MKKTAIIWYQKFSMNSQMRIPIKNLSSISGESGTLKDA